MHDYSTATDPYRQFVYLCGCGCGEPTRIAPRTRAARGWVRGQPLRFLPDHHARVMGRAFNHTPNTYRVEGDRAYVALRGQGGDVKAEAIVDATDLDFVLASGRWVSRWDAHTGGYYVERHASEQFGPRVMLHRFLLESPPHLQVDHINHDTLDNRRANLRLATPPVNARNRRSKDGQISPTGAQRAIAPTIYWAKDKRRWRVAIRVRGFLHVGYFTSEHDATIAAEAACTAANIIMHRLSLTP